MDCKKIIFVIISAIVISSCTSPVGRIFKKKETPHEAYGKKIEPDSLRTEWLQVADNILQQAIQVELPYRLQGLFTADTILALGFQLKAVQGERLTVTLTSMDTIGTGMYTDLYQKDSTTLKHLLAKDTGSFEFIYDVAATGIYLLRIQPRLDRSGAYQLHLSKGPSLVFPVVGNRYIGSRWGADRDGGARSHEGIDIPAPRNTPAVAATDGIISRVQHGGLGGKTVSIRTEQGNLSLYYAHLDSQLVRQGQRVQAGDTIGLVGNTGNAITTGPHLHFGIYTATGAVDPFPFVNKNVTGVAPLIRQRLPRQIKLTSSLKTATGAIAANTILSPLAITADSYLVAVEGKLIKLPQKITKTVKE